VRTGGGFSPDGKYFSFTSAESGRTEVYVEALPPAFGKWQISIHADQPRWRGDGRELFFLALDGKLMAADIRTGPSVTEERDGDPEAETRVTMAYSYAGRDRVAKDDRASSRSYLTELDNDSMCLVPSQVPKDCNSRA